MHTEMDIIAAVRGGELPALTRETLPAIRARQEKLNARFAAAMQSPFVGGNPLPAIVASATKPGKLGRARAVSALLKAAQVRRSTKCTGVKIAASKSKRAPAMWRREHPHTF
jgi:hypothetical protein